MSECCAGCGFSCVEEMEFRGKKHRYLHCEHEGAGHRKGWMVQVGMLCGSFPELAPPAWCPGFERKAGA